MTGETNLEQLIKALQPELHDGTYVFTTVNSTKGILVEHIQSEFKEKEGITLILEQRYADLYNLKYDYLASWITLNVHSSLEAVGLTAMFSNALAKQNISCNVISGYYHDHIFVNINDGQRAIEVLTLLTTR